MVLSVSRAWKFLFGSLAALLLIGITHAQVNVTTYHFDNARSGQNIQETTLTPANVNSTQFGKLYSVAVDGYVYAQPLYLANVSIAGGIHNVLYVATEHDSLYAIDADSATIYWHLNFIPAGGRTVNAATDIGAGCTDIVPEIGITGTPVIDSTTGTLYVVSKAFVNSAAVQYLHAIDVSTSAEKFGGPVEIQASVAGSAYDGKNGVLTFNALMENQRPALLLENGHVIIGWASHCDYDPWHGWLISYSASTLTQEAIYNTSPNGAHSGIWMSGGGVAADSSGNLFFSTGNGDWNGTTDLGDSIVKLGPPSQGTFPLEDYFTPYDQASLASGDIDVSSGGVVLLPTLPSGKQLLALDGKIGTIYLIDRNNMGKYCVNLTPACTANDPQIVQEIPGATAGIWGSPAYWNGNLYWTGANSSITAFSFNATTGQISNSPTSSSQEQFGFAAPTPVVSANGTQNGILWALDGSTSGSLCDTGVNCLGLFAYDATNLGSLLYNSSLVANNRDSIGNPVKFTSPIVANGKVFLGGQYYIAAFGELSASLPPTTSPTVSPAAGTYSTAQTVTLADTTPGAVIYYTTNGTTPTTGSTVYKSAITVSASTTIEAIAVAPGYTNSPVTSAAYTITPSSSGTPVSVSLTADDNVYGIAVNGTAVTHGGMDYSGNAYSETLIGSSITWNGSTFAMGAAGAADGDRYNTVLLPAGNYALINVLATGVDGNEPNQTFTVTYTDGSTTTYTQSLSDWLTPQNYAGESIVLSMPYRLNANGATQTQATYLYGYSFAINSAKTVASLALPQNPNVVVMAVDLLPSGTVTTPTATSPTVSPAAGTYSTAQTVTLADTTPGAVIYYTTNGTTPTTGSTVYKSAITVSASTTIEAIAVAPGYTNSPVTSAAYTITPSSSGTPVSVSLTADDNVYGIAVNGTAVTHGGMDYSGNAYSETLIGSSITWNGSTFAMGAAGAADGDRYNTVLLPAGNYALINVLATGVDGNEPNQTFTVTYTDGSTTTYTQSLSDWLTPQNYAGESIVLSMPYRLNANGATQTQATYLYGYSFAINSAKTVASLALPQNPNVVVMAVDLLPSGTVTTPTATSPTVSPAAGTYSTAQTVTLADTTPGAVIYYTTNGTTPTTGSTVYKSAITVSASTTIEAIAVAPGYTNSPVTSAAYTITPSSSGTPVSVSLTADDNVYGIAVNGTAVTHGGMDYSGNAYSETLIGSSITWNGSTFAMGAAGAADGDRYNTVLLPAGNYALINVLATGVDGNEPNQTFTVTYTDGSTTTYTQSLSDWLTPQNYAGESIVLSMPYRLNANGATQTQATYLYGYSFAINSAKTVASLALPQNPNVVVMAVDLLPSGTVTTPTATSPTVSPAAGTYSTAQTVTLADTTPGAVIYYTTNGTTPTTGSTVYKSAITVSASTTIEAIAVAPGYTNSPVTSAAYTITPSSSGTPVSVSLTADDNVYGIAVNGTAVTHGGMDYSGNAYSETLIGSSITWNGSTFAMGAAGAADGDRYNTVLLPAGNYALINVLATGVDGNEPNQTFTVTYTDGSTTTYTQSLSDWLTPQNYAGESIVLSMPYRLNANGATQTQATYLYGYSFAINSAKTVASLALPQNPNVVVMAVDLLP